VLSSGSAVTAVKPLRQGTGLKFIAVKIAGKLIGEIGEERKSKLIPTSKRNNLRSRK
jgi:hypothetical protein